MTTAATTPSLAGRRILLVEDETYVALLLEDILEELGCVIVGTAASIEDGLQMADVIEADAAMLDVNVGGESIFPVARKLMERGIPVVFATGYGDQGLPEEWRDHLVIRKPFLIDDVLNALRAALPPQQSRKE